MFLPVWAVLLVRPELTNQRGARYAVGAASAELHGWDDSPHFSVIWLYRVVS